MLLILIPIPQEAFDLVFINMVATLLDPRLAAFGSAALAENDQ